MNRNRLIGDRAFYKRITKLATPIVIQGGVTNLISLLDNVMVGQLGTEMLSGVAIANQLLFVFNLGIMGLFSGIGLFTSQYYGKADENGLCRTLYAKRASGICFLALSIAAFLLLGKQMISGYIRFAGSEGSAEVAGACAWTYLCIMLVGLLPFSVAQLYGTTLREVNQTVPAMVGSSVAVGLNILLNYLLIFGKFGFPALGVTGAALATVLSRFAEMLIVTVWAYTSGGAFIRRSWKRMSMPQRLVGSMAMRTAPLVLNEVLYAASYAVIGQCLSTRGLTAIAASNITSNVTQLFNTVLYALGVSLGVVVGNLLGAGRFDEARQTNSRMIVLAIGVCVVLGIVLMPVSLWFPKLFNTTDDVRLLTGQMIRVIGYTLPIRAFTHLAYYTLRSGGRTLLTLAFDGGYVTLICMPITLLLAHFTGFSALALFAVSLIAELSKAILAGIWIRKGVWVRNIVSET